MSNRCGKFERRVTDVVVLVLLWYSIPEIVPLLWCLLTKGNIWVKLYGGACAVGFGWFFGLCFWLAIREEYDEWKTSRQKKPPIFLSTIDPPQSPKLLSSGEHASDHSEDMKHLQDGQQQDKS